MSGAVVSNWDHLTWKNSTGAQNLTLNGLGASCSVSVTESTFDKDPNSAGGWQRGTTFTALTGNYFDAGWTLSRAGGFPTGWNIKRTTGVLLPDPFNPTAGGSILSHELFDNGRTSALDGSGQGFVTLPGAC